jgi:hypothetical protein
MAGGLGLEGGGAVDDRSHRAGVVGPFGQSGGDIEPRQRLGGLDGVGRRRATSRQASKAASSMASTRSAAWAMRASRSASSTVVKRTWLARVWRWMKVAFSGGWMQRLGLALAVASTK